MSRTPSPLEPSREPSLEPSADARLERLRAVARIMDDAVEIPVVGVRLGLDSVLGFLPGAGDLIGAAVSGWTVVTAARLGATPSVLGRMLGNVAVDALVGAVPLLGDLFDVAFKANRRNLRIVEEHVLDPGGTRRRSRTVVWGAVGGVLALLVGLLLTVGWVASVAWGILSG